MPLKGMRFANLAAVVSLLFAEPFAWAIPPQHVLDQMARNPRAVDVAPLVLPETGHNSISGTSLGFDVSNVEVMGHVTPQSFSTNSSCQLGPNTVCANDIWGYVSPSGREYAILGLYSGTGFVDVTNPRSPEIVGAISDNPSIWSDMKTYQHYAYNCTENPATPNHGIQVIDLSLIDPPTRQVSLVRSVTEDLIAESHTLALNEESGHLYLCGSNLANGRLVDLSLADPSHPVKVGQMNQATYVHAAQVVNYTSGPYAGKEIAFCYCGSQGLKIVDVTIKNNVMPTIGSLIYPNTSYTHQGWLTADRRHVLINDELDEVNLPNVNTTTTYVINVENLSSPQFVTTFTNGMGTVDHNLMIRNYDTPSGFYSYAFEANYTSGLRIYDVTNVNAAVEVGWADSYPFNNGFSMNGAWGVYSLLPSGMILLADMQAGLLVIDPTPAVVENCAFSDAPQADANAFPRNRYVTINPNNPGLQTAIRVRLADLPPPFEAFEGTDMWVDLPEDLVDTVNPLSTFKRSRLTCNPVYHDWGSLGPIMISDHEIVPGGAYHVQQVGDRCDPGAEVNYSAALVVESTNVWGDLIGDAPGDPPNDNANFTDVSGLVDKFRNNPEAPGVASSDLAPSQPDGLIDFTDVSMAVDAFRGLAYPYSGPVGCP